MTEPTTDLPMDPAGPVTAPALEMRGITKRYPGVVANNGIDLKSPFVSVFGWQFEYRFMTTDSGWTALSEFIPVGGFF